MEKVSLSTPWNIQREWGIAPLVLNPGTRWKTGASLTPWPPYPRKEPKVTTQQEDGWAPGTRLDVVIRDKSLTPSGGVRILDCPVRILTKQSGILTEMQTKAWHRKFISVTHFKPEVNLNNMERSVRTSLRTRSVRITKPSNYYCCTYIIRFVLRTHKT
jgi:hypothetical protein